jgi:hypothetical protein
MPLMKAYNIDLDLYGLKSHSIFKSVYNVEASWRGTFGHLIQTASAENCFSLEDLRRRSIDPTDLCQYAGYHADSYEKKRDRFRRGLNTKLQERLNTVRADSFNELVNLAISQEDCIVAHRAEKKRKAPMAAPSA